MFRGLGHPPLKIKIKIKIEIKIKKKKKKEKETSNGNKIPSLDLIMKHVGGMLIGPYAPQITSGLCSSIYQKFSFDESCQ